MLQTNGRGLTYPVALGFHIMKFFFFFSKTVKCLVFENLFYFSNFVTTEILAMTEEAQEVSVLPDLQDLIPASLSTQP